MKPVKPRIVILIPRDWCISSWTQTHAYAEIVSALAATYPGEDVHISTVEKGGDTPIQIAPVHSLSEDGSSITYERLPQELLDGIGALVVEVLASHENKAISDFRGRLNRCGMRLSEFAKRPPVLSSFMTDVAGLYAMVIETDIAMLMAADHFGRIATVTPNAQQHFSRYDLGPALGRWGIPFQYTSTASQLTANYGSSGRNRILRNRSVVIFLYELWDHGYRPDIARSVGLDTNSVASDLFGDLRIYRNNIAHNHGILQKRLSTLRFVKAGEPIDLVANMDELFRMIVEEINRIAVTYFGVATEFTLDNIAEGMIVAEGPVAWRSDHNQPS